MKWEVVLKSPASLRFNSKFKVDDSKCSPLELNLRRLSHPGIEYSKASVISGHQVRLVHKT